MIAGRRGRQWAPVGTPGIASRRRAAAPRGQPLGRARSDARADQRSEMLLDSRAVMERDASDFGPAGISGSPVPLVGSAPGYEPVEHTADLAYIVRGRSLEQLFAHAALGMFAFLIDLETVEPREAREVRVRGLDREECLIGFLQELLFREETEGFLVTRVGVQTTGPPEVVARVWGEPFDPARHDLLTDIKAATYHDLEFRTDTDPKGELHRVRIVLDI